MSNATPQELGVLAKLVIVLAIVLIVAGVLWHGVRARFDRASPFSNEEVITKSSPALRLSPDHLLDALRCEKT